MLGSLPTAWAETLECSGSMAAKAHSAVVGKLHTWDGVYWAYRKYRQCDDGAIAGGFAEAISILLAEKWSSFPQGAKLMKRDPQFRLFVRRHLGEATPQTEWVEIVENTSKRCPQQYTAICKELGGIQ